MILHDNFRTKLDQALKEKGWSQSDLAREMCLSRQMISDYMNGRKCPGLDVVERFAKAVDTDPWNLIDDKPLRIATPIG